MALFRLLPFALAQVQKLVLQLPGQTLLGPEVLRMVGQILKAVGLAPQRDLLLSMVVQMEQVGFVPGQMVMAPARVDQTLLDPGVLQVADQILLGLPVAAAVVVGPLVQKGS